MGWLEITFWVFLLMFGVAALNLLSDIRSILHGMDMSSIMALKELSTALKIKKGSD